MTGDGASTEGWIDSETKVAESPDDHRSELHLWLRLLTCTTLIESEVRRRLREEFDFTLPRFDLLAQLEKAEDGLVLGELSKRMMVSAGNITALVERLVESGYITRTASPSDKRVQIIKMTPMGHDAFARMAKQHGDWIAGLFEGLGAPEIDALMASLARLKTSVRVSLPRSARAGRD
jgi:DNA-binding MarR family transcriptional regulator